MLAIIKKTSLLLHTLQHLRGVQVWYRLLYFLFEKRWSKLRDVPAIVGKPLVFVEGLRHSPSYDPHRRTFTLLNHSQTFENEIDWDCQNHDHLWRFQLNYFDCLHQAPALAPHHGEALILEHIRALPTSHTAREPYVISVKGINWIFFLSEHRIQNSAIDYALVQQFDRLTRGFEYDLMANHLLENAFALLFGAYYFEQEDWYRMAKKLLQQELTEQVLPDGGHFELSPMYQQILLGRLLDCYNLVKNNAWENHELLDLLQDTASRMLAWLNGLTLPNGDIPRFNDVAEGISPSTEALNQYARRLGVSLGTTPTRVEYKSQSYNQITTQDFNLVVDTALLGPDYFLAHAHADTFCFELYLNNEPFVINTGTSTYQNLTIRQQERATAAHNTVAVGNRNSSEVWGSFRVARRAKIIHFEQSENSITATHNGYTHLGVLHTRKFEWNESSISIEDTLTPSKHSAKAYFHFHENLNEQLSEGTVEGNSLILPQAVFTFIGAERLNLKPYWRARGFNQRNQAVVLEVSFKTSLRTEIQVLHRS